MSAETDLLVVGAGAKAAALAAKVHALNTLGLGPLALTIVEATELAASWSGRNGMTSGEEPLAIPPIKDVGFPYQSYEAFGEVGDASRPRDDAVHLAAVHDRQGEYARWVNAGSPAVQHRDVRPVPHVGALSRAPPGGHARARAASHRSRSRRQARALDGRGARSTRPAASVSRAARWCSPARASTGSPARPRRRGADLPLRQQAHRAGRIPLERSATSRSSAAARARSAAWRSCAPSGRRRGLTIYTPTPAAEPRRELPGESRLLQPRRGRLERSGPADAPRLRQALRPGGVRPRDPGGTIAYDERAASSPGA